MYRESLFQSLYVKYALQNQKFMHDKALVQARAESRIPGTQYNPNVDDYETNREILGVARSLYGTGLRA